MGGGAVPLCGQGGLGLCPRLGCHGLASPEWRTGLILHLLTCLWLAVFAAELINIPTCWCLYECTADTLHILRTAATCLKLSFCSVPVFFGLDVCYTLCSMQHMASRWQQPFLLQMQKRGVVDFTRRRRWLRRRRQDLTRPSPPPPEAPAPSPRQSPAARRTTSIR